MKNLIALLLCLALLCATAVAEESIADRIAAFVSANSEAIEAAPTPSEADEAVLAELTEANSWENIIARHTSKTALDTFFQEDGKATVTFARRIAADSDYSTSDVYAQLALPDRVLELNLENGQPLYTLLFRPGSNMSAIEEAQQSISMGLVDGEHLIYLQDGDDYCYTVTETDDPDTVGELAERTNAFRDEDLGDLAWQEGMKVRFYMVFDRASGDLLANRLDLFMPDGSAFMLQLEAYEYDTPEEFDQGLLADWYAAKDIREMTVVFDADTDQPETVTYSVPRGFVFDIKLNDAFPAVYTDEAMTAEMDYNTAADMDPATLYIRADGT